MPPTEAPTETFDTLLTLEEVMAVVKLRRTACREALKSAGAPDPVIFNARCHRWWATEVYAWLHQLQTPTIPVDVSTFAVVADAEPPVYRAATGRRRKHTV